MSFLDYVQRNADRITLLGLQHVQVVLLSVAFATLPLAWPVILNGTHVTTIMLVAIAAIGAVVRGPGLGELIFRGLALVGGANAGEGLRQVTGARRMATALTPLARTGGAAGRPRAEASAR